MYLKIAKSCFNMMEGMKHFDLKSASFWEAAMFEVLFLKEMKK